jgi:hypothetical protein
MSDLAVAIRDVLVIVFIHGFKGTDTTFGEFPARLQHVLAESVPNASVGTIEDSAAEDLD